MSYGLEFTKRAIKELGDFEIWLQEETLDELEIVAANPTAKQTRRFQSIVHDFIREGGERRYYVFITYRLDHAGAVVRVGAIGGCSKAVNPSP